MVLLLLRAPIFGLLVTIVSVIAELAFLSASLRLLTYLSCRSLKNGKRFLKLRSHSYKVWAITALATVMFVSLETLLSVFSDVARQKVRSVESCLRLIGPAMETGVSGSIIEGRAVYFRCAKVNKDMVTHMIGNFSTERDDITCSSEVGYSYRIGAQTTMNRTAQMPLHCNDIGLCATSIVTGDMLYMSNPGKRSLMMVGQNVTMMPTNVSSFNKELIDARILSERLTQIYAQAVHMEGEVRRRLLLETTRSRCEFERDERQATEIPFAVLATATVLWVLSLVLLALSQAIKHRCFFDANDPLHWARYAQHHPRHEPGMQPLLQRVDDGSHCRIRVLAHPGECDGDSRSLHQTVVA
eukprot:TRINITY_DN927_c0_g1_i1.p1 TRINITY_DN927_c0_g1~~TRINITY_DN927_c0_g1_i1.p1  ORF type:complete len:356 (+),score=33.18 TRINITY_DN927_c0_g1_i1:807-1874(+)